MNPIILLIDGTFILIVLALILWPEKGIWARLRQARVRRQRILLEDTLKQLYDHEYYHKTVTIASLAGALNLSQEKTTRALQNLAQLKLAVFSGGQWHLTAEGRGYALRILRIHRLWERYLADETGISEAEWHRRAEKREHDLTMDEADRLSETLGYPVYDPHGDPIPNRFGELPPRSGRPLTAAQPGTRTTIVHLEDEPAILFEQLSAEGLYPGMAVTVVENNDERVVIRGEGKVITLAPVVAANITIPAEETGETPESDKEPFLTLADIRQGETAEVIAISPQCRGMQRRRLMDLGIIPGSRVTRELESMGGDPVAYNVRGALIALRGDQARLIRVKLKKEQHEPQL